MIVKINGTPVEDVIRDCFDVVGVNARVAYSLIHTPIEVEVSNEAHSILVDANLFNIPQHALAVVKPHVMTAFEYLF